MWPIQNRWNDFEMHLQSNFADLKSFRGCCNPGCLGLSLCATFVICFRKETCLDIAFTIQTGVDVHTQDPKLKLCSDVF